MKLIKKLVGLFSQKKTPTQKINLPKQPLTIIDINAKIIGIVNAVYSPKELVCWLNQGKHKRYKTSQVEVLDISQNGLYVGTVFAVTTGDTIYWVQVGTHNIYSSPKSSLTTSKSESFRLLIKNKNIKQIKAICHIKEEEIEVIDMIEERYVPPTDTDIEGKVRCRGLYFPCTLAEAADAIQYL